MIAFFIQKINGVPTCISVNRYMLVSRNFISLWISSYILTVHCNKINNDKI
jgi:hypothetical protein